MSNSDDLQKEDMAFILGKHGEYGSKVVGKKGTLNLWHNVELLSDTIHQLVKQFSVLDECGTQTELFTRLLKIYGLSRDLVSDIATEEHIGHSWVRMPYVFLDDAGNIDFRHHPVGEGVEVADLKFSERKIKEPDKN